MTSTTVLSLCCLPVRLTDHRGSFRAKEDQRSNLGLKNAAIQLFALHFHQIKEESLSSCVCRQNQTDALFMQVKLNFGETHMVERNSEKDNVQLYCICNRFLSIHKSMTVRMKVNYRNFPQGATDLIILLSLTLIIV